MPFVNGDEYTELASNSSSAILALVLERDDVVRIVNSEGYKGAASFWRVKAALMGSKKEE